MNIEIQVSSRCFLPVRDHETVKHYRIRQTEQGRYYIARRMNFQSLSDLVAHYSHLSDGLCVNLRKPCVHVSKPTKNLCRGRRDEKNDFFSSDCQT